MTPEEEESARRFLKVIVIMLDIKAEMIKAGQTHRKMECPRCGGMLQVRLEGRRNHARMGCAGLCGMQAME